MSRIRLLPKHIAEKIAAGEVVERPASVVKELLENAIDAGASIINLEIKNGGVRFIRVADNCVGISAADVPTAVLRHATSKIYEEEDLEAIGTLGFRGEALASITAVSKVEIITRTADELEGNRIVFHGGERIEQGPAGCPKGTTTVVRDLFYNTPARMKFLKKDVTEAHAVRAVVERLALSHPEISFGFLKDGRKEMQTPGDNRLIAAIHAVLGREFAQNLLPVKYELGGVSVSGFVLKPVSARSNRTMQFFFLNGRLVRSRTAVAALEQAYKGSIMVGRFPGCVLHITLSSALVDVNVHPAKTEVRFANEKSVFEAIYYAVKTTIAEKDPRPSLKLETPETHEAPSAQLEDSLPVLNKGVQLLFSAPVEKQSVFHMDPAVVYTPVSHEASGTLPKTSSVPSTSEQMNMEVKKENTCSLEKAPDEKQVVEESSFGAQRSFRVVGQCFTTYILVEQGDTLYMIDKH
ncbi:MAG TPA: DNA mismatch repair endonuclease MutL, partial [Ruminococcaceae bacterium]|nr:DNA mismatch repair endonuclease MutL [Oscillospiraceae bacterium]